MPDIRMHYNDILKQISTYLLERVASHSQSLNLDTSGNFSSLGTTYNFDIKNSDAIDSFIHNLSLDSNYELYSEEIISAAMCRIICLKSIFDAKYISSYLTVPEDITEAIPLILIDLWKSCRMFVEAELDMP